MECSLHTHSSYAITCRWRHVKSKVTCWLTPALVWFSYSPELTEANTSWRPNSATLSSPHLSVYVSVLPLCLSVCLHLWLFLSACTPKCRLMPWRTDRLNANPWVVQKPAPGSQLWVCVCVCECARVRACLCASECVQPATNPCLCVCWAGWTQT